MNGNVKLAVYFDSSLTSDYQPLFEIIHGTEADCLSSLVNSANSFHHYDCMESCTIAQKCEPLHERQGPSTLVAFVVGMICIEICALHTAFSLTFPIDDFFRFFSTIFACELLYLIIFPFLSDSVVVGIWRYSLRQLSVALIRVAPKSRQYHLSRIYQLRENVALMTMLIRIVLPCSLLCFPTIVYLLLPPQYKFERLLSIAFHDWWIAVVRSTVLLFLPFIDDRFRKASIRIFQRYVTQSQPENANAYFDWPDRDLR
ncbi:hypothetical protein PRIPAC_82342 [Pristionchus pacificus]|uniref:Uncharacterized protein n=1 Tax=Pristionchus pacificus TaxID=54126 RepID=A0A2A6CJX5_PRIPA|nr:hypothetical protein PRIPAC_82342 [Pristionchus pacificus]|eukprot:PDM78502.1 hypothetical protein PRIPAC_31081 [Pristionchus pacificus]